MGDTVIHPISLWLVLVIRNEDEQKKVKQKETRNYKRLFFVN